LSLTDIYFDDPRPTLVTGDDNISGGDGNDIIDAGNGNDSVNGDFRQRYGYRWKGRRHHPRGSGNDTLSGDGDDDSLTGGSSDGVFLYAPSDGHDTITDFNTGTSGALGDGSEANNDFIDPGQFYDSMSEPRRNFDNDGILNQSNSTTNGGTVDYSDNAQFGPNGSLTFECLIRN